MKQHKQQIYLDSAATTPLDPEIYEAMRPYFLTDFGNPGSLHSYGQDALRAVDEARETIAEALGRPRTSGFREIIFTGSATEANNLALRGVLKVAQRSMNRTDCSCVPATRDNLRSQHSDSFGDQARNVCESCASRNAKPLRLIISEIEHDSVLETAKELSAQSGSALGGEHEGFEVIYLPVDKKGIVNLKKLKEALNERTVLVSVMYGNNEIGSIQPIAEIATIIREYKEATRVATRGATRKNHPNDPNAEGENVLSCYPLFHTDAVQAFQYCECNVDALGVDYMTLSAHKLYGPKGIGVLFARSALLPMKSSEKGMKVMRATNFLEPMITGGGQEFGMRSGTENVPLIVGCAMALRSAKMRRAEEVKKIIHLKTLFLKELKKKIKGVQVNGADMLPHILNLFIPQRDAHELLIALDREGIAVSSGSACAARATKQSHVLSALGCSEHHIRHSIRFSFGNVLTEGDVKEAVSRICRII